MPGGLTGLTTGFVPIATSSTTVGNSFLDYNITNAGDFTFTKPVIIADGSGIGAGFSGPEGTAEPCATSIDSLWADSTAHRIRMCNNNGAATSLVGFSDLASITSLFGVVKVDNTTITASGGVISASGGAVSLIQEVVTSGLQTSVTFTGVASSFRDLVIKVRGRSNTSATFDTVDIRFNSDTSADYNTQTLQGTGTNNFFSSETLPGNATNISLSAS